MITPLAGSGSLTYKSVLTRLGPHPKNLKRGWVHGWESNPDY